MVGTYDLLNFGCDWWVVGEVWGSWVVERLGTDESI